MGVLYSEPPEGTWPGNEQADLAEIVAEWRRVRRAHLTALEHAADLGQRALCLAKMAEKRLAAEPGRWLADPPPGCRIAATIELEGD